MEIEPSRLQPLPARVRTLQFIILFATSLVTFAALVLPMGLSPAALPLRAGDVAPRDLQAPRAIEYVSEVRTEEARQAAERAVVSVYAPPDPSIARQQIERLHTTLQFISQVRADPNATPEQKASDLAALSDVRLRPESIEQILAMPESRWNVIQQEALRVLEQVMRSIIRENDVDTVRRSVPSLVSLALSEQEAGLVAELAMAFVQPNSLYSDELTVAARQSARDAVQPVVQIYKEGERIVPGGEIITPADIEALERLGMIQPGRHWEDYLGAAALTAVSAVFVGLYYFRRWRTPFLSDIRSLEVIALTFLLFLIGARLALPDRVIVPYLYPLPAVGLLLTTLFGMETGIIFSVVICALAGYGLTSSLALTPYYLLASLCGVVVLWPARRFWSFVRAGMAIAAGGTAVIAAYRLPFSSLDWVGILTLLGAALFNGLASASLALLLQSLLAQILGLPTPLQLLEISRPDFPLLQFFLRNAPGTYQHSLQVANLAEQAAEKIGADPLLTRVGALLHDVGKAADPAFFVENQAPGQVNTHTDMSSEAAAAQIIRHIHDGVALARRHRLPRRIDDFILEHHGTMLARYQYNQAIEKADGDAAKVDIEKFRYPGPRPRSRETALVMLADGTEARARAESPEDEEGLRAVVRAVVERALKDGQLDNTQLTLRDLNLITESFVTTLRGTYHHPRIQYPAAEPLVGADVRTAPLRQKRRK